MRQVLMPIVPACWGTAANPPLAGSAMRTSGQQRIAISPARFGSKGGLFVPKPSSVPAKLRYRVLDLLSIVQCRPLVCARVRGIVTQLVTWAVRGRSRQEPGKRALLGACDQAIFADQATEAGLRSDAVVVKGDRFG